MKAYSTDLRKKVIDAYKNQEGSQRNLAKRFSVSLTFIQKLLKQYRNTGTVEPKPHGGGNTAKLSSEQMVLVAALIEEDNDAILVELCDRLEGRTGVKVSRSTMGRITQKLNLTRKKKHYTRAKNIQNESKNLEQSIGQPLVQ
ncbi:MULTISPECIES: helix-turn-helix domain-containing protein [Brasilonema]|uniref:helix-turn-helix domain-containing protein n=1 Tax=Brasilonema TaxID=383614 RepID=UPI001FE80BF8|nr:MULTISPECIES: transposase [Brasilonema]